MFVTYNPHDTVDRNGHVRPQFTGNTVTILKALDNDFYRVGAYDPKGDWSEWYAHIDELDGFEGV